MRLNPFIYLSTLLLVYSQVNIAQACDLCAIYTSLETQKPAAGSIHFGVAEQFSHYGTLRKDGKFAPTERHERFTSSITQVYGAYDLTSRSSLQLTLPYINRRYRRFEEGTLVRGTEAGIGDMTLIYRHVVTSLDSSDYRIQAQVLGGIKLPTGDSGLLNENHHSEVKLSKGTLRPLHGGHHHDDDTPKVTSAIHGHDLALGSGSIDFPLGASLLARSGSLVFMANTQYTVRNEGDHDYRYANELIWSINPGYFLVAEHDKALLMRMSMSGEYKKKDRVNGREDNDTALRTVFAGPGVLVTLEDWISGELSWDIPIDISNSGTQVTADYRVRAAVNVRF